MAKDIAIASKTVFCLYDNNISTTAIEELRHLASEIGVSAGVLSDLSGEPGWTGLAMAGLDGRQSSYLKWPFVESVPLSLAHQGNRVVVYAVDRITNWLLSVDVDCSTLLFGDSQVLHKRVPGLGFMSAVRPVPNGFVIWNRTSGNALAVDEEGHATEIRFPGKATPVASISQQAVFAVVDESRVLLYFCRHDGSMELCRECPPLQNGGEVHLGLLKDGSVIAVGPNSIQLLSSRDSKWDKRTLNLADLYVREMTSNVVSGTGFFRHLRQRIATLIKRLF